MIVHSSKVDRVLLGDIESLIMRLVLVRHGHLTLWNDGRTSILIDIEFDIGSFLVLFSRQFVSFWYGMLSFELI
jgi:hypothetical protein